MSLTAFEIAPLPMDGPRMLVQFDGFAVPQHFIARSRDEGVSLEIKVTDRGEPRCIVVSVRNEEGVSGESLRRVPVARLVKEAFTAAALKSEPMEEGGEPIPRIVGTTPKDRARFYERFAKDVRQPRSGSPLTDDHLGQVAELYRAAVDRGDPPTQTVAETMHVERPTAGRWVAKARERGLLGPAKRGRGGEAN
jgi:hypothetical protein